MQLPPGINPRMFAFLQAQRQLQHGQPPQHQSPPLQHQSPPLQPHQPQRPGGDADVASFLLQLKTNQNGEPVSEAEAFRFQAAHQAALAAAGRPPQHPPQHIPLPHMTGQPPVQVGAPLAGYPIPGMYGYPGMIPFQGMPNGNFAAAAAVAMGGMQPGMQPPRHGYSEMHPSMVHAQIPVHGMTSVPVAVSGMNHPQIPGAAQGMPGVASGAPAETGPVITDAYIESLITNDVVANNKSEYDKTETGTAKGSSEEMPTDGSTSAKDDMNIALVVAKDRDLIPDALFVALGQMKPCRLQQSDRVGCYKTRSLGFLGMSCKHCGGQPGFGRYFPNSVRSLAQTTTSQTILKHIGGKCRFCPPNVRKAVLELQRQQAHKEHITTGRPRYGSRKIFFQRMWARLHGKSADGETAIVVEADVTPEKAKEEAEKAAADATATIVAASSNTSSLELPSAAVQSKIPLSSGAKRSFPPEVSNNNTDDDEDSGSSTSIQGERGVLNMNLTVHNNDNKKRKIENDSPSNGESNDNDSKKVRISQVAI